jgi:hypothetical protein
MWVLISHSNDYSDCGVLDCDTVYSYTRIPSLQPANRTEPIPEYTSTLNMDAEGSSEDYTVSKPTRLQRGHKLSGTV